MTENDFLFFKDFTALLRKHYPQLPLGVWASFKTYLKLQENEDYEVCGTCLEVVKTPTQPKPSDKPITFYRINQNNSGGKYIIDKKLGIGKDIFIEACTPKEAWRKFEDLEEAYEKENKAAPYFHAACDCCGERWPDEVKDYHATTEEKITNSVSGCKDEPSFVHYLDGTIKCMHYERNGEIKSSYVKGRKL